MQIYILFLLYHQLQQRMIYFYQQINLKYLRFHTGEKMGTGSGNVSVTEMSVVAEKTAFWCFKL